MRIQFSADDLRLEINRVDDGKFTPAIAAARDGTILVELSRAELRGMLMAIAQAAVEEHGAVIQSADLSLASVGQRALSGSLRLRAKKLLVSVNVTIEARAEVDVHLALRISDLKASGVGLIDSMVAGALHAKLREYEGRTFDLAPEALKNLSLTELKVEAGDPVRISAGFGA